MSLPLLPSAAEDSPAMLAARIDWLAENYPNRVYSEIPVNLQDLSAGYQEVTWRHFKEAIDRAAWWLQEAVEAEGREINVFGYTGPYDLRWLLLLVAGIKTGRTLLLNYSWAPPASIENLYKLTGCDTTLHATDTESVSHMEALRAHFGPKSIIAVPEVSAWLVLDSRSDANVRPFPFTKTYDEVADAKIAYFQSSGTTGLPKPIFMTNKSTLNWKARSDLMYKDKSVWNFTEPNARTYVAFHVSHISGILSLLLSPVFNDSIPVWGPDRNASSLEAAKQVMRLTSPDTCLHPPALLSSISHDEEAMQLLGRTENVLTGGAALDEGTTQHILDLHGPQLHTIYASVEMQGLTRKHLPPSLFPYMSFHEVNNAEFQHVRDDLYELVFVRRDELPYSDYQPVFTLFPDRSEYRSRDLFSPHPTQPGAWRHRGRVDDTVVLASGQNVYVADVERKIEQARGISAAVVYAGGKRLVALVEVEESARHRVATPEGRAEVLDELWPAIEVANAAVNIQTQGAVVTRETAIVATADKPLPRLAKRSVDRRNAKILYKDEIDRAVAAGSV